jgi:hypothetical protein
MEVMFRRFGIANKIFKRILVRLFAFICKVVSIYTCNVTEAFDNCMYSSVKHTADVTTYNLFNESRYLVVCLNG